MKSLIARLAGTERTVRVGATEDERLEGLRSFCTSHNARLVLDDSLPDGRCRVVVDDEVVATDDLTNVWAYLSGPGEANAPVRRSPVLDAVVGSQSAVRAASTAKMVRVSREVERRAWRTAGGTLRSGFQTLSTLDKSVETRERYEQLAEVGVDVTVYGAPDVALEDVPFEVRPDREGRLRDFWFVLYDGDGRPPRSAALVCEQSGPDEFTGYWTRDSTVVADCFVAAAVEHPDLLGEVPDAVEDLRADEAGDDAGDAGTGADTTAPPDADFDFDFDAGR